MLPILKKKTSNAASTRGAFGRAVARFKTEQKQRGRVTRIGFLIDATSSRAQSWVHAQKIQAQMFRAVSGLGAMALRLVHFGGGALSDHGWMNSPQEVATAMNKVECVTGLTQFVPGLRAFLEEGEVPDAIILVGDMFEENADEAAALASALKNAGVKIFTFLEGDDQTAAAIFSQLADRTGGRFVRFGAELPLRDLCEGVALLTAGGKKAMKRLQNKQVKHLLLTAPSEK